MGSFVNNSFGTAIPVQGPNVGFVGQISRSNPRNVRSRVVLPTTPTNLPFGAPAVLISNATGGNYQSVADYLGTPSNAQYLRNLFAGIAGREVKTEYVYTALNQSGAATYPTTGTASSGSTSLTVASATGIAVNQSVEGAGIAAGTYVTAVSGTTITLSQATTAALSSTTVVFTASVGPVVGLYNAGEEADVLLTGSITVAITAGTVQANGAVYIRTVANSSYPGTAVGDLEALQDLVASPPTVTTTVGGTTITVSANTGLAIGQQCLGFMFGANTFITNISGTTVTISQPTTVAVTTNATANFSNTALLGGPLGDPWVVFSVGQQDTNGIAEVTIKNRYSA